MSPRILLVAEGGSDEVIAEAILRWKYPTATIDRKGFPARGFRVVHRSTKTVARAAHFGHYDLLVVHFDLDDSLVSDPFDPTRSVRIQAIRDIIEQTFDQLPAAGRSCRSRCSLMAARQSTDAWVAWGSAGGIGCEWEKKDRRQVKAMLYKSPPRNMIEKATEYAPGLLERMRTEAHDQWPASLLAFFQSL